MHFRPYLTAAACLAVLLAAEAEASFFVTSGEGARPKAMGEAYAAVAGDVHALWYNPAGLAALEAREIALGYSRLFPGLSDDQLHLSLLGAAMPMGRSAGIGLGLSHLSAERCSETAIAAGYGKRLGDLLRVGATAELLGWQAEGDFDPVGGGKDSDHSKWTPSLAVGAMLDLGAGLGADLLRVAFAARDLLSPNISESGDAGGELPVQARLGVMHRRTNLSLAMDVVRRNSIQWLHMGAEYTVAHTDLALRMGGYAPMGGLAPGDSEGLNGGFGYQAKDLLFDYAFSYPWAFSVECGSHQLSVRYRF